MDCEETQEWVLKNESIKHKARIFHTPLSLYISYLQQEVSFLFSSLLCAHPLSERDKEEQE